MWTTRQPQTPRQRLPNPSNTLINPMLKILPSLRWSLTSSNLTSSQPSRSLSAKIIPFGSPSLLYPPIRISSTTLSTCQPNLNLGKEENRERDREGVIACDDNKGLVSLLRALLVADRVKSTVVIYRNVKGSRWGSTWEKTVLLMRLNWNLGGCLRVVLVNQRLRRF
ncbi:hypothetical protein RJ641_019984 [Dillenia turbinata]|uniref:Uncharacterized protein n=1 Tax=Dillenia turbinata TaxID=194707 RepID=A0AAN8YVZ7_9MAGN